MNDDLICLGLLLVFLWGKKSKMACVFSCLLVKEMGMTAEGRAAGQSCCPWLAGKANNK